LKRLTLNTYLEGILQRNRVMLARAISLAESTRPADRKLVLALLEALRPHMPAHTIRVAITGLPGAGKSTFIEAFGQHLTARGKNVAVLTVDPTSPLHKGSILGDKTRMNELARNPLAFVRPSASGRGQGGVAPHIREAMWMCEAAGYEIVLLETVGVGQAETAVKNMVDFFMLFTLAGAGDDLQGIKRGIMEMADAVVITKADGENLKPAQQARTLMQHALHLLEPPESGWTPQVVICSAFTGKGLDDIWKMIEQYYQLTRQNGYLEQNRSTQLVNWMQELVQGELQSFLQQSLKLNLLLKKAGQEVISGKSLPQQAASRVMEKIKHELRKTLKS
jgi:LAO/AO transport system kinase